LARSFAETENLASPAVRREAGIVENLTNCA
jgi:hypothetical protein